MNDEILQYLFHSDMLNQNLIHGLELRMFFETKNNTV